MMQFDYLYQMQATGQLDVEDVGNCCISAIDDLFKEWILIIKTDLGLTKIIQWGPMIVDCKAPCTKMFYSYEQFQFSDKKIASIIEKFLNGVTCASQAQLISLEEAKDRIKNLVEFLEDD